MAREDLLAAEERVQQAIDLLHQTRETIEKAREEGLPQKRVGAPNRFDVSEEHLEKAQLSLSSFAYHLRRLNSLFAIYDEASG